MRRGFLIRRMGHAPIITHLMRLLRVALLVPFLALTLIPAQMMPARGADGTLTIVLCVNGGAQTVTVDLTTGKPVRQAADGRCDWACAQMAVVDLAQPVMPVVAMQARQAQPSATPTILAMARATGLPPATGPPGLL